MFGVTKVYFLYCYFFGHFDALPGGKRVLIKERDCGAHLTALRCDGRTGGKERERRELGMLPGNQRNKLAKYFS